MKDLDRGKNYLTNAEIIKRGEIFADYRIKCPNCGHSITLTNRFGRVLCNWCGKWVYKDSKTEFKYKLKEKINGNLVYDRKE